MGLVVALGARPIDGLDAEVGLDVLEGEVLGEDVEDTELSQASAAVDTGLE